jgi:hypothetical protein
MKMQFKDYESRSGKALNIAGGSACDGAIVEQYGFDDWSPPKCRIQDTGGACIQ